MMRKSLPLILPAILLFSSQALGQFQGAPQGLVTPSEIYRSFLESVKLQLSSNFKVGGHLQKTARGTWQYRIPREGCFDDWLTIEARSSKKTVVPNGHQKVSETLVLSCSTSITFRIEREGPSVEPQPPANLLQFAWPPLEASMITTVSYLGSTLRMEYGDEADEGWSFIADVLAFSSSTRFEIQKSTSDGVVIYDLGYLYSGLAYEGLLRIEGWPDSLDPTLFTHKFFAQGERRSRELVLDHMNAIFRNQLKSYVGFRLE